MNRLSYKCLPTERRAPVAEKTKWLVMFDGKQIGHILALDSAKIRSLNASVWQPVLFEGTFNELSYPHLEESDSDIDVNGPYVLTNDSPEHPHNLELHCPMPMNMYEARRWIQTTLNGD